MVVKLKTPLFLFPLVVGNKIRKESFSNNAFCQGFLSLPHSSRIQHQQNMLDHVLVWKQREKSIHFTRVRLWDSRLLLSFLLPSSLLPSPFFPDVGNRKRLRRIGWAAQKRVEGQRVWTAETYTATVNISEVEPKPQIQFCFSANHLA